MIFNKKSTQNKAILFDYQNVRRNEFFFKLMIV